jgi:hypothetical protein
MQASQSPSSGQAPDLRNLPGLLVLVGAGKMGGALLDGWLRLGLDPARIAVIEPKPAPQVSALAARGVRLNPDLGALKDVAAIVIAVKPQMAAEVLPALAPMIGASTVVVSIMAGRTLQFLSAHAQERERVRPRHAESAGVDRPRHHRRRAASTPATRSAKSRIAFSPPPERSSGSKTRLCSMQ